MSRTTTDLLYLVTIVTFVLALRFLSSPKRARQGNLLGAAGMTLALDLRESGLSVILLESGGFRREAQTQRLSDGRMTGINTWNLRTMRIRALGGATGHWEGWCRPLMPQDFEYALIVAKSSTVTWPPTVAPLAKMISLPMWQSCATCT